jgi:hypothetical protein
MRKSNISSTGGVTAMTRDAALLQWHEETLHGFMNEIDFDR